MRTKEEWLNDCWDEAGIFTSGYRKDLLLNAMDEYAKELLNGYEKWLEEVCLYWDKTNERRVEIYLEHINKQAK